MSFIPNPPPTEAKRNPWWLPTAASSSSSKAKKPWEQWRLRVRLQAGLTSEAVEEQVRHALLYITTSVLQHLEQPDPLGSAFRLQVPGQQQGGQETWTGMLRRVLSESTSLL